MNKSDFIRELSLVLSQRQEAEKAFNKVVKSIHQSLNRGEKVVLSGVGSFYPKMRKAQKRHNPKTMEIVYVPPKRSVKFIPSQDLFKKFEENGTEHL